MPLSPAPRGGACWGGHILTGAPPLHLSLPGFVPLPHSPPISSGNLGRESGLHISLSSFLVARFPDGPSPATTPFFFNHFLHPPLSAPNLAPRTPPPPHPLHNPSMHPCTGCDRGTDSVWLSASHIRHRRRPSPSPPLVSSSSTSQSMDGPIPQPRKGYFAICNLQSAPAGQTPVSVVITSMDLHHTTLAQRPGVAFADLACVDTVMVLSRH